MSRLGIRLKHFFFVVREPSYSFTRAYDQEELLRIFRRVLKSSNQFFYICLTSRHPILMEDPIRDTILEAVMTSEGRVDFKVLIHEDWSRSLGFFDASFRLTNRRIGDFVVGDSDGLILAIRSGGMFNMRKPYPGENRAALFRSVYETSVQDYGDANAR